MCVCFVTKGIRAQVTPADRQRLYLLLCHTGRLEEHQMSRREEGNGGSAWVEVDPFPVSLNQCRAGRDTDVVIYLYGDLFWVRFRCLTVAPDGTSAFI